MGYLHINNLYKAQEILLFKECYAMEKIHGTSAHVGRNAEGKLFYFSGGGPHDEFVKLLGEIPEAALPAGAIIFGEYYGGKLQAMRDTYGPEERFVAFDVKVSDHWLCVPAAEQFCRDVGIDFVAYAKVSTELAALDAERDKDSTQAEKNGMGSGHRREGVVLRPIIEMRDEYGERIIAKHKRADFEERQTPPKVVDPNKLIVLQAADDIAREWVTPMRLVHVLDKLGNPDDISATGKVINAMVEDVYREARGEIVEGREVRAAIGKKTAVLYKERLEKKLRGD